MIDINIIRSNGPEVIERLKIKNFDAADIIKNLGCVDEDRRKTMKQLEDLLAEGKGLARQIGQLMKEGKKGEAEEMKERTVALKVETKRLQDKLDQYSSGQNELLMQLPNIPHALVPRGKHPTTTRLYLKRGRSRCLAEGALAHWDLAKEIRTGRL
jgi:seryl-tRNA synthetase